MYPVYYWNVMKKATETWESEINSYFEAKSTTLTRRYCAFGFHRWQHSLRAVPRRPRTVPIAGINLVGAGLGWGRLHQSVLARRSVLHHELLDRVHHVGHIVAVRRRGRRMRRPVCDERRCGRANRMVKPWADREAEIKTHALKRHTNIPFQSRRCRTQS